MHRLTTQDGQALDALAARGAARLDVRRPNWFKEIELNNLDMSSGCKCICGQLYGEYSEKSVAAVVGGWVRRLVRTNYDHIASKYGFFVPEEIDNKYYGSTPWSRLENAWKREVRARRAAA